MFDFAPVGLVVALSGILFLVTIGWRLLPKRAQDGAGFTEERFSVARYLTELRLPVDSSLAGRSVGQLEMLCENEISVMAVIRGGSRRLAPRAVDILQQNDVLIIEGDSDAPFRD